MCFTGDPGTGRPRWRCGWPRCCTASATSRKGHLVAVTRDDLVGQYIGHTAPKTKEVLKRAMGGVLFIDEAYYLYRPENERDYGQEAIEILLQVMENQRDDLVVILAGYKDRMDTFFRPIPGMSARGSRTTSTSPTTPSTSWSAIAELMIAGNYRVRLPGRGRARSASTSTCRSRQPAVRQRAQRAQRRWNERGCARPSGCSSAATTAVTKDDLMQLEPADFLASRVFSQPDPGDPAHRRRTVTPPPAILAARS